jgi:uncharacterized protein
MELFAGFLIGLLGSFHCIGMCGPIALALPKSNSMLLSRALYNVGRIVTYSLLGLLFGILGSRLEMFGLQQVISISLGILILLLVVTPRKYRVKISIKLGLYKIIGVLKSALSGLFKSHSNISMLSIGILNGLLPCGFVYIGITGAIAIGSPMESMMFMVMFGLGTLPVMLGASILGGFVNISLRQKLTKFVPIFSIILAVIFILRGLNLGVPYLSPKHENRQTQTEQVICH